MSPKKIALHVCAYVHIISLSLSLSRSLSLSLYIYIYIYIYMGMSSLYPSRQNRLRHPSNKPRKLFYILPYGPRLILWARAHHITKPIAWAGPGPMGPMGSTHGPGPRARGAAGPGPGPGPAAPRALGPGPWARAHGMGRRMHSAAECIQRQYAFRGSMHSEAVCIRRQYASRPPNASK